MKQNNSTIEKYRVCGDHPLATDESYGNNGAFLIPGPRGIRLAVVASDGGGWEHVSVHRVDKKNCPFLEEMSYIKDLFWLPEEAVMQLHPPQSTYVNNHPSTLHLWRPVNQNIPLPPACMVGIKSLGNLKES